MVGLSSGHLSALVDTWHLVRRLVLLGGWAQGVGPGPPPSGPCSALSPAPAPAPLPLSHVPAPAPAPQASGPGDYQPLPAWHRSSDRS
eukprot:gene23661-9192_t